MIPLILAALLQSVPHDPSPRVVYEGQWEVQQHSNGSGNYARSSVAGASVTFTFGGGYVALKSDRWWDLGRANVYVDGQLVATITQYGTPTYGVTSWEWAGATEQHVVRVVVQGVGCGAATCWTDVDGWVVEACERPPLYSNDGPTCAVERQSLECACGEMLEWDRVVGASEYDVERDGQVVGVTYFKPGGVNDEGGLVEDDPGTRWWPARDEPPPVEGRLYVYTVRACWWRDGVRLCSVGESNAVLYRGSPLTVIGE